MFLVNYNLMYLFILVMFSILTMNINSLFFTWTMMELNLLMVIPLLLMKSSFYKEQTSLPLKYFIVQVLGSLLMLISLISMDLNYMSLSKMNFIFLNAIMLKAGMPPLHFWFPQVIYMSNSMQSFILLCVQKIIPIFLISMLMTENIMIFIFLSALLGGLMGLNQNSIMKLLAYSSMVHSSWMISGLINNMISCYFYFMVYSIISYSMLSFFGSHSIKFISELINNNHSKSTIMFFIISMLTLSGTPPFIGFFSKIIIISSLLKSYMVLISVFLIMGSTLSFFYYLRTMISMSIFGFTIIKEKKTLFKDNSSPLMLLMLINLSFLMVVWLVT